MSNCKACFKEFDSLNRKPLRLSCGHGFCFSCISSLPYVDGAIHCTKCKKSTLKYTDQMLVNNLAEKKPSQRDLHPSSETACLQHQKALDYLCMDCMELVCFACTRGTHAAHKIDTIDDLLQGDETVVESRAKIRTMMKCKLKRADESISEFRAILEFIDKIDLITPFKEGHKILQTQRVSTEQDLQAWDTSVSGADENKRHQCREILKRLLLEPEEIGEFSEIKKKMDAAGKDCHRLKYRIKKLASDDRQHSCDATAGSMRHSAGVALCGKKRQSAGGATPGKSWQPESTAVFKCSTAISQQTKNDPEVIVMTVTSASPPRSGLVCSRSPVAPASKSNTLKRKDAPRLDEKWESTVNADAANTDLRRKKMFTMPPGQHKGVPRHLTYEETRIDNFHGERDIEEPMSARLKPRSVEEPRSLEELHIWLKSLTGAENLCG
ncbi:uncharacterized protein LOC108675912 [Hyalella azteca]|uniref:Uncharacterized protein LOC108675912 n=1 Tax=Hyalella azteca TaxID=294128 RepID=A0A8B7P0H1_HYAAZ|nr:uncharacterized protein LOC108675912 [Hyalella azteca]